MPKDNLTQDELKCLTLRQFAELIGVSWPTAKRLFADGKGPPKIQLSKRRVGIRVIDARRWQEARLRT